MYLKFAVGHRQRLFGQFAGRDLSRSGSAVLGALAQQPRCIAELSRVLDVTQPGVTSLIGSQDADALLGAESSALHDPVGEMEAAPAEAGTRR